MGCIGPQESIVILGILVVIMGAGRLPQLGEAMGRSLLNFRRAISGKDEVDVTPPKQVEAGGEDSERPPV